MHCNGCSNREECEIMKKQRELDAELKKIKSVTRLVWGALIITWIVAVMQIISNLKFLMDWNEFVKVLDNYLIPFIEGL